MSRFEAGRWGRFLSPDPYLGSVDASNPQSLNRYSYVDNNPANLIDPLGLIGVCPPGMQTDSKGTGCEPKHGTLVDTTPGGGTGGPPAPAPGPPDPPKEKKPKETPNEDHCKNFTRLGDTLALTGAVNGLAAVGVAATGVGAPLGAILGGIAAVEGLGAAALFFYADVVCK